MSAQGPSSVRQLFISSAPKLNEPAKTFLFLGPYSGCILHYCPGTDRYHACSGVPSQCTKHKLDPTWKAFAPAWEFFGDGTGEGKWLPTVAELTESFAELLDEDSLRGEVWQTWRVIEDKKRVKVVGRFVEARDPRAVAQPFDIMPTLFRRYKTNQIEMGVPPPWGKKVYVNFENAPPPAIPAIGEKKTPETTHKITPAERQALREAATASPGQNVRVKIT